MMLPLFFLGFIFLPSYFCAQNELTYTINNCLTQLYNQEKEDWIGYFISPPANTIAPDTSSSFVMSYAAIPVDHVSLDLDYGYWYGNNNTYPLLHGYIQVLQGYSNLTIRWDIIPWKRQKIRDDSVSYYVCWEKVDEPSYFGLWVWYNASDTLESCQKKTSNTPNC